MQNQTSAANLHHSTNKNNLSQVKNSLFGLKIMQLKNKIVGKEVFKSVFIVLIMFVSFTNHAQGIQQKMNTIEVDNLSDEQVANYSSKIKEEGYTLEQALAIAKTKGMSEIQAQKLKTRIRNLSTSISNKNKL